MRISSRRRVFVLRSPISVTSFFRLLLSSWFRFRSQKTGKMGSVSPAGVDMPRASDRNVLFYSADMTAALGGGAMSARFRSGAFNRMSIFKLVVVKLAMLGGMHTVVLCDVECGSPGANFSSPSSPPSPRPAPPFL